MKRRLVGLLLLGLLAPLAGLAKEPEPRRIGVWLTNSPSPLYYSSQRINKAVEELSAAGFNTLYPNVWSRHDLPQEPLGTDGARPTPKGPQA